MAETSKPRVLLADDDCDVLWTLGRVLVRHGFDVTTCGDGVDAVELLEEMQFRCVITDVQMPELNGLAVLAWVQRFKPETPVIVMTAYGSETVKGVALRNGAIMYLEKPVDPLMLVQLLSSLDEKPESFSGIVAEIDLFDYVQLLLVTNRSLILTLHVSTDVGGKLWITEGNIVHAELGKLRGEEAVYECLALPGGNFSELPWSEPEERTISTLGTHLVLEAARRKDEHDAGQQVNRASWKPAAPEEAESGAEKQEFDPNSPRRQRT